MTGPPGHHSALVRAESFEATLAAHGVEPAGGRVWFGAWSEIWGRQAAQGLVAADRDIDAVFCGSDTIARGVADGLREGGAPARGRRGASAWTTGRRSRRSCRPPLTTIDLKLEAVGANGRRAAARRLSTAARPPARTSSPPSLVVRESSGPPGPTGEQR